MRVVEAVEQPLCRHLDMRAERRIPFQWHAQRQHLDTVPYKLRQVVDGLAGNGHSHHDVGRIREPAQNGLEGREQHREQGGAVCGARLL